MGNAPVKQHNEADDRAAAALKHKTDARRKKQQEAFRALAKWQEATHLWQWPLQRRPDRFSKTRYLTVHCVAWTPDDSTVAIGCQSRELILLDGRTGAARASTGRVFRSPVKCCAFYRSDAESGVLVAGTTEGSVRIFSYVSVFALRGRSVIRRPQLTSRKGLAVPEAFVSGRKPGKKLAPIVFDVAWAPAAPPGDSDPSGGVGILAVATADIVCVFHMHEPVGTRAPFLTQVLLGHAPGQIVYSCAWHPHAGGALLASASADQSICLWSLPGWAGATTSSTTGTDTTIRTQVQRHDAPLCRLSGHTAYVRSLAWLPSGKALVSGSGDGTLKVWSTGASVDLQGKEIKLVEIQPQDPTTANVLVLPVVNDDWVPSPPMTIQVGAVINSVDVASQDDMIAAATADGRALIFDATTGAQRGPAFMFQHLSEVPGRRPPAVRAIKFSLDAARLGAGTSDGRMGMFALHEHYYINKDQSTAVRFVVKALTGRSVEVRESKHSTVGHLKAVLEKATGVPRQHQRLLFSGSVLEDDTKRLRAVGIVEDGAIVFLTKKSNVREEGPVVPPMPPMDAVRLAAQASAERLSRE